MIGTLIIGIIAQTSAMDWDALPPLPFNMPPKISTSMQSFVAREAHAAKCSVDMTTLKLDVAVLLDEQGHIRATVPRAIQCPNIEQYAAALVVSFADGNLLPRMTSTEQWYRANLDFTQTQ